MKEEMICSTIQMNPYSKILDKKQHSEFVIMAVTNLQFYEQCDMHCNFTLLIWIVSMKCVFF